MKRRIFTILAIVWMVIIFIFSARNADISTEDSHRIGMWIGQVVISDFEEWSPEEQEAFAASIDHPIRKTAHASEYFVLAVLVCW